MKSEQHMDYTGIRIHVVIVAQFNAIQINSVHLGYIHNIIL